MRRDVACVHILHPNYYTFSPCTAAGRAGDRFSAATTATGNLQGALNATICAYVRASRACKAHVRRKCRSPLHEGFDGAMSVRLACIPYGAPLNSQLSAIHVRWQLQSEALHG